MRKFFEPDSTVVIGVSDRPGNMGRNIVDNLELCGYRGDIHQVSPRGGEYRGRPIHASVSDLPAVPELAVILTPAPSVPGLMAECGQKGIKRVIVESGGFSELSPERRGLETELNAIAGKYGMRFIGPNCIGVVCAHSGLAVPFPMFTFAPPAGGVSIISQSGGIGLTYLFRLAYEELGVANFASVGNKVNVNEEDLLAYYIADPKTEVILLYLESIVAGRRMCELIRSTDKPVIVHKSNTGDLSHAIASSHTSAMVNDDAVVEAALAQAGAIRAHTVDDCIQLVKGASLPRARGKRLAVISRSGGHAVVAADAAAKAGFELPPLSPEYLEKINESVRASVIKLQNPLDLGDLFEFNLYNAILDGALSLDQVDAILLVHGYRGPETEDSRQFLGRVAELSRQAAKPVAVCLLTDPDETAYARKLAGIPVFSTPEAGILALDAARRGSVRHRPDEMIACADDVDWGRVERILKFADEELDLPEALHLVAAAGIPVADFVVAGDPDEAAEAAGHLGLPVAVKAVGVSHKTDSGGVALDLTDEAAVRQAAGDMFERLGINRVVVMSMVSGGREIILGAKADPSFGPVVLAGLGGVFTEVLADFSLALAPVDELEAGRMLDSLQGSRLLGQFRGQPPVNRLALLEAIMRLSHLAQRGSGILELDINPLLAGPGGVMAVDARCRVARSH